MSEAAPVSASVIFSNGERTRVPNEAVTDLYDLVEGLNYRRRVYGGSDKDEGSEKAAKSLGSLGGRTEFERALQRRIVEWLRNQERPRRPHVMVIGDSIRMRIANATGYGLHTYRHLVDKVNLTHIPHNCGGSSVHVVSIEDWLRASPDLIHINCGLHDLAIKKRTNPPRHSVPIDEYRENLKKIFTRILRNGKTKVIWALNTPVDDEWHLDERRRLLRYNGDVVAYNEASAQVAREFGLPITDLYTPLVKAGIRNCLRPDGVHLNHVGSRICGQIVAEAIEQRL